MKKKNRSRLISTLTAKSTYNFQPSQIATTSSSQRLLFCQRGRLPIDQRVQNHYRGNHFIMFSKFRAKSTLQSQELTKSSNSSNICTDEKSICLMFFLLNYICIQLIFCLTKAVNPGVHCSVNSVLFVCSFFVDGKSSWRDISGGGPCRTNA